MGYDPTKETAMTRPEFWGLVISSTILLVLICLYLSMVLNQSRDRERFGRYAYKIFRSGSFVYEGSSYRCEDPESLDWVARLLLEEWFDSEAGERELMYCSNKDRYRCVAFLEGYGAGEAVGR